MADIDWNSDTNHRKSPKVDVLEQLRILIERKIPESLETNYAEVDMLALSFQSRVHSERYVWIYTDAEAIINIDLED